MTFQGFGAVVTGASSGLGAAISHHMASLGADVLAVARRPDRLRTLVDTAPANGRIVGYEADVSNRDQVEALTAVIQDAIGRVDLLVNNAGVETQGRIEVLSDDALDQMWAVNVAGMIRCTRVLLPWLRASRGMIINLGSTAVDRPPRGRFGYIATKGAVEALTRALAVDLGRDGVRVNLIRPGIVPSELRGLDEKQERIAFASSMVLDTQALPAVGDSSDIAAAVAWLAGDGGRWVTGASIDVDGGYSLGLCP